jgi:hypothetical protein
MKVRCISIPDESNIVRDITVDYIYEVAFDDGDDFKLSSDDCGNSRYYDKECFEIIKDDDI